MSLLHLREELEDSLLSKPESILRHSKRCNAYQSVLWQTDSLIVMECQIRFPARKVIGPLYL